MKMATNVYKRKDGRFEARYANGLKPDGKTKYSSVFGKSYAEVKEKLVTAKAAALAAPPPVAVKATIREAVAEYLDSERCRLKASTLGVYRRHLDIYITPHFGDMPCSSLTASVSQEFVNRLIENGLAVRTAQSVFALMRTAIQAASGNVFKVRFPKPPKRAVNFFTIEEQKKLEQAAKDSGSTDYVALMLCLYAGIRIGEVCGLQWGDIDLERGLLSINRTMQRIPTKGEEAKTAVVFLSPKSSSSERTIPLPGFLLALLKEARPAADCEFVISSKAKPIEPRTIQNHFKKICSAAGVGDVNFHTTRHSFAVRALESGFDVKSLSEILGHANATITLNRYAHATDTQKRSCMNALAAVYSGSQSCGKSGSPSGKPGGKSGQKSGQAQNGMA